MSGQDGREAEVRELHCAIAIVENVLQLQVEVDDGRLRERERERERDVRKIKE